MNYCNRNRFKVDKISLLLILWDSGIGESTTNAVIAYDRYRYT